MKKSSNGATMTTPNNTIRKLAEITDAGLFERLATDVLRSCKPSLYESLSHPGVNAVRRIRASNPPQLRLAVIALSLIGGFARQTAPTFAPM